MLFPAGAPQKRNLPSLGPGEENSLAKNLDTLLLNAETDVSPEQPEIKPKPRGRKPKPKLAELVEDKEEEKVVKKAVEKPKLVITGSTPQSAGPGSARYYRFS